MDSCFWQAVVSHVSLSLGFDCSPRKLQQKFAHHTPTTKNISIGFTPLMVVVVLLLSKLIFVGTEYCSIHTGNVDKIVS
jgi:hypothetical protein